jgi:hypothetical protein
LFRHYHLMSFINKVFIAVDDAYGKVSRLLLDNTFQGEN